MHRAGAAAAGSMGSAAVLIFLSSLPNLTIRVSLALKSIAKGNRFKLDPDSVHDWNYGSRLEFKSWQHRAELVNRQRIVAVQQHISTPVAYSDNEQLDLEIFRRLPLSENV
jgi:hypothetical protein